MDTKSQRILNIYETGVSETELTENLKTKINASAGGSLGSIKPTDAAPTPARNGNYTFSIGGNKPAWLTAEAGVTTVKAGDGVAVVYDGVSAYTYTHVDTGSSIEQVRSQSTGNVPSSKLMDDEFISTNYRLSKKTVDSEILTQTKNLYNKALQISGQNGAYDGYLDDTGALVSHPSAKTSYYIPLLSGIQYAYQAYYGYSTRICTYAKNYTLLRIINVGNNSASANGTFTAQSNEYFVRFTIQDVNTFMVEIGSTQSTYEAYIKKNLLQSVIPVLDESKIPNLSYNKIPTLFSYGKNLYNKALQISGQNGAYDGYLDNSGSLVVHGTAKTSYYMDILPGLNYAYQAYYGYETRICTYDSDKTLVRIINLGNNTASANGTFTAQSNEYFVRFSIRDVNTFMLEFGTTQSAYEIFRPTQIKNELLPDSSESFENVKFVIFGDSITEDTGSTDGNWVDVFNSIVKPLSTENRGYGGSHYSWDETSIETITPSMDNNVNNTLWNHIKKWEATSPTTPNVIIIALGTNDISQGYTIGNATDAFAQSLVATSQLTTANAMRKAIQYLQMTYPTAKLFVTTPIHGVSGGRTWSNLNAVSQVIKDVANVLNVPVIDCFNGSGICWVYEVIGGEGRDLYDGTHPKASGANKQGSFIANEFMKKYFEVATLPFT